MAARRVAVRSITPGVSFRSLIKLGEWVGIFIVVCFVMLAGAAGFFAYRIATAHDDTEAVTPSSFLLTNFESLPFTTLAGGEHDGWLLRGLRGAPVIVICHGYGTNRSEGLPLATVLQENHFNVYVFNFRGGRGKGSISDLGVSYIKDLKAAIQTVTSQRGINPRRVGLFGRATGAYAALAEAEQNPAVKVLVVDSVYDQPDQMFDSEMAGLLGGASSGFFQNLAEREFHLLVSSSKAPDLRQGASGLRGLPKLFIAGRDSPVLMQATESLYQEVPEPKQMLIQEHTQAILATGSEKKEYQDQILNFFLQNLPLRAD